MNLNFLGYRHLSLFAASCRVALALSPGTKKTPP